MGIMFAQEEAISKEKRRSSRLQLSIFSEIVVYNIEMQVDVFSKNDLCSKIAIFSLCSCNKIVFYKKI